MIFLSPRKHNPVAFKINSNAFQKNLAARFNEKFVIAAVILVVIVMALQSFVPPLSPLTGQLSFWFLRPVLYVPSAYC